MNKKHNIKKITLLIIMIAITLVMIFPMIWMLLLSLKNSPENIKSIFDIVNSKYTIKNFTDAFIADDFIKYFTNSIIVASIVTIGNVFFCSMAGYAIARKNFRGKHAIIASLLMLLIIPAHIVMIPLYKTMATFNWLDSYLSLIIPWIITPFGIFLMKQYIETIPTQIEDAARIDGANEWQILFKIIIPLCKPIVSVLAIYTFINNWNSFLFPFLFTNGTEYRTLPVGLTFYLGKQSIDWGHLMAGASIAAIPLLLIFIVFQKKIIYGITEGALKE